MKHKKLNVLILLLITGFILWYILKDSYQEIGIALLNSKHIWIIVALGFYYIYLLFDILTFNILTKMYSDKVTFKYQVYLGFIYKFFSGITPLASGGQPMQVYELRKKGVSITDGTAIAVQSYIMFHIALMSLTITAITVNKMFHLFTPMPILTQMTIIGFIINFCILVILCCVCFTKTFNRVIVGFIIKVLSKLHIVKKPEEQLKKWRKRCDDYYYSAHELLKHKGVFIKGIIFQACSLLAFYLIPFFLAKAFSLDIKWYSSLAASCYVFNMGCYVPIPGASGGMEYGFAGFFGHFVTGYYLDTLLVSWRFITYYLPVVVGAIVFNVKKHLDSKQDKNSSN